MSDSANIKFYEDEYTKVASALRSAASALESCASCVPGAPSGPSGIGTRLAFCRSQLREAADRASQMAQNTLKASDLFAEYEDRLSQFSISYVSSTGKDVTFTISCDSSTGVCTASNDDNLAMVSISLAQLFSQLSEKWGADITEIDLYGFRGVYATFSKGNIVRKAKTDDNENIIYDEEGNIVYLDEADTTTGTQCSEYVNRFYQSSTNEIAVAEGVKIEAVHNLYANGYKGHDGIPEIKYELNGVEHTEDMQLVDTSTSEPQAGDILSYNDGNHWAIVESVSGDTVTVIEQNWVNYANGSYNVTTNRHYSVSSNKFYHIPATIQPNT
ncbi:MAG TPA: CHAP domain-containing protein [Candidatus Limiplasma sp.]|nr:CHAP domain-containing protein [Candidatus Limiplasma sp.]